MEGDRIEIKKLWKLGEFEVKIVVVCINRSSVVSTHLFEAEELLN